MELKNLDIVTLKNGIRYFYVEHGLFGKMLINQNGHISFDDYDENFRVKRDIYNFPWDDARDVAKIERTLNPEYILQIDNQVTQTIWDYTKDVVLPVEIIDFLKEFPTLEDYKKTRWYKELFLWKCF